MATLLEWKQVDSMAARMDYSVAARSACLRVDELGRMKASR